MKLKGIDTRMAINFVRYAPKNGSKIKRMILVMMQTIKGITKNLLYFAKDHRKTVSSRKVIRVFRINDM
jgi:hypothetical protein